MSNEDELLQRQSDGILRLTINRAQSANSITSTLAQSLARGLERARDDESVGAVILTAAGERVFSAGADLKNPDNLDADALMAVRRASTKLCMETLLAFPKPLVVALNGGAVGLGCMLTFLADEVVAAETAYLSIPEINLGIATFTGHALLAHQAGEALASDVVRTGRRMAPDEALRHGLLVGVAQPGKLDALAEERARLLAAKPAAAFGQLKGWVNGRKEAVYRAAMVAQGAIAGVGTIR